MAVGGAHLVDEHSPVGLHPCHGGIQILQIPDDRIHLKILFKGIVNAAEALQNRTSAPVQIAVHRGHCHKIMIIPVDKVQRVNIAQDLLGILQLQKHPFLMGGERVFLPVQLSQLIVNIKWL